MRDKETQLHLALSEIYAMVMRWGMLAPHIWPLETCKELNKFIEDAVREKLHRERVENE
jgi:hypothetical protein